jgi:DNA-directed RNA polymerase subunit RPC12/RpoP
MNNSDKRDDLLLAQEGLTFYRCQLCATVVSKWDIVSGDGCPKCGGLKLSPSRLSLWEKLVQIWRHPRVWDWGGDPETLPAEFPGEPPDV